MIPEAPVIEEVKVQEILRIDIAAAEKTIECVPDKKIALKINVTNNGTVTSPPLSLTHEYTNEKDEEVQD